MGLGPEQPRRRSGELSVVKGQLTVHRGGQYPQPRSLQRGDSRAGIRRDDDRYGEDAASRRAKAFAVVGIDTVPAKDHRCGTHRIGDADQRPRVARFADLHSHCDQPGRAGQHIVERGLVRLTHRHQARRSHRVRQGFCGAFGDEVNSGILPGKQSGKAFGSGLGDKDLPDQSAPGRCFDQVGAFRQKKLRPAPRKLMRTTRTSCASSAAVSRRMLAEL